MGCFEIQQGDGTVTVQRRDSIIKLGQAALLEVSDKIKQLNRVDADTIQIELKPDEMVAFADEHPKAPVWFIIAVMLYERGAPLMILLPSLEDMMKGNWQLRQSDICLVDGWNRVETDKDIITGSVFYVFRRI